MGCRESLDARQTGDTARLATGPVGLRATLRLAWTVSAQIRADRARFQEWGLNPNPPAGDGGRYVAPYVATWYADRLSTSDIDQLRLHEMLLKFLVLIISVEDDVFEECGPILGVDYFRQLLAEGVSREEPARMSVADFQARGIPSSALNRPNRFLADHLQGANKIDLVNGFLDEWLAADGVIESMPLGAEAKRQMRLSFVRLRNGLLASYIQERELIAARGLSGLSVADWLVIIEGRATPIVDPILQMLGPFRSGGEREGAEIGKVLEAVVLLSSMCDDLKDFETDWWTQPNLLAILARGRDRTRLEAGLMAGGYSGPGRGIQLIRDAPRTLRVWHRLYGRSFLRIRGSPYEASVFVFGMVCYLNALRRRFSRSNGHPGHRRDALAADLAPSPEGL